MKFPGSEVNIVLPPWPDGFGLTEMLEKGIYIHVNKKTGAFFFRVGLAKEVTDE